LPPAALLQEAAGVLILILLFFLVSLETCASKEYDNFTKKAEWGDLRSPSGRQRRTFQFERIIL
jgi:hypothetical protein